MTEERAYGRYLGGPVITQRYSYDPRGLEISYTMVLNVRPHFSMTTRDS